MTVSSTSEWPASRSRAAARSMTLPITPDCSVGAAPSARRKPINRSDLLLGGFERRDSTLHASDLALGAHATPAERSRDGELAVELLELPARGVELGVGRRLHRHPL